MSDSGEVRHPGELNSCYECGNSAHLTCAGCKGCPTKEGEERTAIYYCSKRCQEEAWKTHESDCRAAKDRQILYRAANLTKQLLYIQSKITFATGYYQEIIERSENQRVVLLEQPKSEERKVFLIPFSTVTDLVSDPLEQDAHMMYRTCQGAVLRYGEVLEGMIKNIDVFLEEVVLLPANSKIEISKAEKKTDGTIVVDETTYEHTIFRATINDDEMYAIDLTGAQNGYDQECVPWEEYSKMRIQEIVKFGKLGLTEEIVKEFIYGNNRHDGMVWIANNHFATELKHCVESWTHRVLGLEDMVTLPQRDYDEKKTSLLETVGEYLATEREVTLNRGTWTG